MYGYNAEQPIAIPIYTVQGRPLHIRTVRTCVPFLAVTAHAHIGCTVRCKSTIVKTHILKTALSRIAVSAECYGSAWLLRSATVALGYDSIVCA